MYDASIQNPVSPKNSFGIQPTQFPKYDFGQSLDSVMNNAIQYKIAQSQLGKSNIDLQNAQIQQNQSLSPFGVSPQTAANPQAWQQANQPQQIQPEPGQGQGMMANPGQPMPEDSQITGLRMMQQAAIKSIGQQVAQTQAQTQNLQAQAAQATGMNQMMGFGQQGQGGAQQPNMFEENINALKNGSLSPSLLSQQMSRAPEPLKIGMAHAIAQHLQAGDLNMEDSENTYQKKQAQIQTQQSPAIQVPLRLAQSTLPVLNKFSDMINQVAGNNWQSINKLGLAVAQEKGDPLAQKLKTQALLVSKDVNSILGGQTDIQFEGLMKSIDTSETKVQLQNSARQLRDYVQSKINAFGQQQQNPQQQAAPNDWDGSDTYTYPDGTKTVYDGNKWVKQ